MRGAASTGQFFQMPNFSNKATFPNLLAEQFFASLPFSSRYMTRYETINPADASSSSSRPWIQVQWMQKRKKKLLLLLHRRQRPFNNSTQAKQSTRLLVSRISKRNKDRRSPNTFQEKKPTANLSLIFTREGGGGGHSLLCKNFCG